MAEHDPRSAPKIAGIEQTLLTSLESETPANHVGDEHDSAWQSVRIQPDDEDPVWVRRSAALEEQYRNRRR